MYSSWKVFLGVSSGAVLEDGSLGIGVVIVTFCLGALDSTVGREYGLGAGVLVTVFSFGEENFVFGPSSMGGLVTVFVGQGLVLAVRAIAGVGGPSFSGLVTFFVGHGLVLVMWTIEDCTVETVGSGLGFGFDTGFSLGPFREKSSSLSWW